MKKILLASVSLILLASCAHRGDEVYKACTLTKQEQTSYADNTPIAIAAPTFAGMDTRLQKARDAHVSGCASVGFQIDGNGNPYNITVVKEAPKGYGFGDEAVFQIQNTKYTPPTKANELYFVGNSWRNP